VDEFLVLVGRCYGVAGLAHGVDFATGNALPAAAGLAPFAVLPPVGQALGVVWVLLGLVQPLASTRAAQQAGLVAYGVYEIVLTLASWPATTDPDGNLMRLGAAVGVQLLVGYCYVELRRQSLSVDQKPEGRTGSPRMSAEPPLPEPKRAAAGKGGETLFNRLIAATPDAPLWQRLAVYCPFLLLLVPSAVGPETAEQLQASLGPFAGVLAALRDALTSPLVESRDLIDAAGVPYGSAWSGTAGLKLVAAVALFQVLTRVVGSGDADGES